MITVSDHSGVFAKSRFARFLLSGALNTAVTYLIYLALLQLIPYIFAYTVSYAGGIAMAFFLNRMFVFKTHRGLKSLLLFPLVYLVQYCVGLIVAVVWVEGLELPRSLAPIASIIVTIPITFILSRAVFARK